MGIIIYLVSKKRYSMDTTAINSQITDAVTQTNVKTNGETPGEALSKLEQEAETQGGDSGPGE